MAAARKNTKPLSLLLIEDNPGDSYLVQESLKESKYSRFDVTAVTCLSDGIKQLSQKKFDVVLTDLGLPDAMGFDAIQQLKKHSTNLPIVVLTSTDQERGLQAMQNGAQDYLVKEHIMGPEISRALVYAVERKNADLKSQFAAIISHELRIPLTVIKEGLLLAIGNQLENNFNESQKRDFEIVLANVNRLERLINNILSYSKLEAQKQGSLMQEFDLKICVEKVEQLLKALALKKGLKLQVEVPETSVLAHCNPDQIEQLLINLVENALKFTDKGKIIIRLTTHQSHNQLEVQDTGVGIKKSDQTNIFDFFSQGSFETQKKSGGTGLGLAICRLIATAHGGELVLQSEWGKGSTFRFSFPRHPTALNSSGITKGGLKL